MASKKEFAIERLRQIFSALHEKRFAEVAALVDESTMDENDLLEFVQGTAELNDFSTIDVFQESGLCYVCEEDDDPFEAVSYLYADGGNELPLSLHLELKSRPDGSYYTALDIQPD